MAKLDFMHHVLFFKLNQHHKLILILTNIINIRRFLHSIYTSSVSRSEIGNLIIVISHSFFIFSWKLCAGRRKQTSIHLLPIFLIV